MVLIFLKNQSTFFYINYSYSLIIYYIKEFIIIYNVIIYCHIYYYLDLIHYCVDLINYCDYLIGYYDYYNYYDYYDYLINDYDYDY